MNDETKTGGAAQGAPAANTSAADVKNTPAEVQSGPKDLKEALNQPEIVGHDPDNPPPPKVPDTKNEDEDEPDDDVDYDDVETEDEDVPPPLPPTKRLRVLKPFILSFTKEQRSGLVNLHGTEIRMQAGEGDYPVEIYNHPYIRDHFADGAVETPEQEYERTRVEHETASRDHAAAQASLRRAEQILQRTRPPIHLDERLDGSTDDLHTPTNELARRQGDSLTARISSAPRAPAMYHPNASPPPLNYSHPGLPGSDVTVAGQTQDQIQRAMVEQTISRRTIDDEHSPVGLQRSAAVEQEASGRGVQSNAPKATPTTRPRKAKGK